MTTANEDLRSRLDQWIESGCNPGDTQMRILAGVSSIKKIPNDYFELTYKRTMDAWSTHCSRQKAKKDRRLFEEMEKARMKKVRTLTKGGTLFVSGYTH